jgi:folate-binding protein YgfZ
MFSLEQYRALRETCAVVDRTSRGRVRLTGRDRRDYLQGLLTNDIAALSPGTGCYACLLTAQGRMISDMYLTETGEAVLLDLEPDVTAKVVRHLDQFVFSEDVQIVDESAALAEIGLFGPGAAAVVSHALGRVDASDGEPAAPARLEAMRVLDNITCRWAGVPLIVVRRDDVGVLGFDLVIERARGGELTRALREAGARDAGPAEVEVTRVEGGRPIFHKDMDETTIPLEAGIEDRAISLTKGCYVGQEIIIRVLHRGHGRVARRLAGLTVDGSSVPSIGDRIRSAEREIGSVTSAVWSPALDRPIAMGYVHRDFAEPSTAVAIVSGEQPLSASVTRLPFVPVGS